MALFGFGMLERAPTDPAQEEVVSHDIYQAIFRASSVLEIPIVIAALLSLAVVIFELGAFAIELFTRRGRTFKRLQVASEEARRAGRQG